MEISDGTLARRAREGDAHAFEQIVDRHYDDCLRYAARMLGNRADAEEAVQDAFLRAYRSLGRYDERDRLRSWIFRILVNRCRSHARSRSTRWNLLSRLRLLAAADPRESKPELDEGPGEIHLALARLPADQREAFLLKYVEELSYPEMSEVTGARISALKMRVKRACERLRVLLREEED